jgi:stearoyl-CoA desaturase (delta-9 desaturase)
MSVQITTGTDQPARNGTACLASDTPKPEKVAEVYDMFRPKHLGWSNMDWIVLVWMTAMHVGLLAAPFFITWQAVASAAVLHWLTCSIGVCLAYHRCLSHGSFRLVAPVRFLVTVCGVLAGQGTPLMWSAIHRVHHGRSDKEGDPHSPQDGVWWSHILWLFIRHGAVQKDALYQKYIPDLKKDPMLLFFERTYMLWLVAFAGAMYAIGGWPMMLWTVCARIVLGYHTTWLINSASHIWGYRNYETTDDSRNLWWAGLLAYGEGWHNNHHAWPRVACYGHRWWEFDITWQAIKLLRVLGLATHVDDRLPAR